MESSEIEWEGIWKKRNGWGMTEKKEKKKKESKQTHICMDEGARSAAERKTEPAVRIRRREKKGIEVIKEHVIVK